MHKYLRAIGFSNFTTNQQLNEFLIENQNDIKVESTYSTQTNRVCTQHRLTVCPYVGLSIVCENNVFDINKICYSFPYIKGDDYTLSEECTIEMHSDNESYAGIIDDERFGIAIIFHIINADIYCKILKNANMQNIVIDKIYLSALSIEGKIIMPVEKSLDSMKVAMQDFIKDDMSQDEDDLFPDDDEDEEENEDKEWQKVEAYEDGSYDDEDDEDEEDDDEDYELENEEDIEKIEDDIMNQINSLELENPPQHYEENSVENKNFTLGLGLKVSCDAIGKQETRLNNEDLYSIVDTSLAPFGIESDKYQIIAEILSVQKVTNKYTSETLVEMRVETMGLLFSVIINEKDLDGEPEPGRRFKGVIWLQGIAEFLLKNELPK